MPSVQGIDWLQWGLRPGVNSTIGAGFIAAEDVQGQGWTRSTTGAPTETYSATGVTIQCFPTEARGYAYTGEASVAILAVDHEGKGNAAAAKAWGVIAAADASALPDILAGMDGANPLAANWLGAAVDAVVTKAGGSAKLPLDSLVRFLAFVHVVLRLGECHGNGCLVLDDSDDVPCFYLVHISSLIFAIQFRAFSIRPTLAGVSAPECPRDTPCGRVALFARTEALGFFVDFVSCKVTHHPSDRFGRKIRSILNVPSTSNADLCAAASELFAPL
jgi:hypothetical protein